METIKVKELQKIFDSVIEKLEFELGSEGEIETQTVIYRFIPSEDWNKLKKPEDWYTADKIGQGDLSDDVKELKKLILERNRLCTYVDFDRLSSLLKEISQIRNPI